MSDAPPDQTHQFRSGRWTVEASHNLRLAVLRLAWESAPTIDWEAELRFGLAAWERIADGYTGESGLDGTYWTLPTTLQRAHELVTFLDDVQTEGDLA